MDELPLECVDLLIKQVVILVDEADKRVGDNTRVIFFQPGCVRAWARALIRPIRWIRPIKFEPLPADAYCAHGPCLRVVFGPLGQTMLTQKVLVVE